MTKLHLRSDSDWTLRTQNRTEVEKLVDKIKDKYPELTEIELKKIANWSWDKLFEKMTDYKTVSVRYPKFGIFAVNYYKLLSIVESLDDELSYSSDGLTDFQYNRKATLLEKLRPLFNKCKLITKTNEFKIYHKKQRRYS